MIELLFTIVLVTLPFLDYQITIMLALPSLKSNVIEQIKADCGNSLTSTTLSDMKSLEGALYRWSM